MCNRWGLIVGVVLGMVSRAAVEAEELRQLTNRLLTPPAIEAAVGFTATVLVPPGFLYDPLFMVPHGEVMWINDGGGEGKDKGSRLLAIDGLGTVSVLAGVGTLLPGTGFDIAPPGFGEFSGQLFALAQGNGARAETPVTYEVQRVDPKQGYAAHVFCTLSERGNTTTSDFGGEARFGPEGSPFAGKFYAVNAADNTIYQATFDGKCTPFVTFDEWFGSPCGLTFAADGKSMLVTVARDDLVNPTAKRVGAIVRVSPDGSVANAPVVRSLTSPSGLALAPAGLVLYAGQIFVADRGSTQTPAPRTHAVVADGKVYRVTRQGELYTVASGLVNPTGVRFIGNTLWVSDTNGDVSVGKRELPDGFVVAIQAR